MRFSGIRMLFVVSFCFFSQVSVEVFAQRTVREIFDSVAEAHPGAADYIALYGEEGEKFVRGDRKDRSIATIVILGPGRRSYERCSSKIGQAVVFKDEWERRLENWYRFGPALLEDMVGKDELKKKCDAVRVVYLGFESIREGLDTVISKVLAELRVDRESKGKRDFCMLFSQGPYTKIASRVAQRCPEAEALVGVCRPIDLMVSVAPPKKWSYRWFRFWRKREKGAYRYKFVLRVDSAQMPANGPGEEPKKFGVDIRGLGRKVVGRVRDTREETIFEYFTMFRKFFKVKLWEPRAA